MITKPELQRLIICRLNFMHITEERPLSEIAGSIIRQPFNTLEWALPEIRYCFGGDGATWEDARTELIEGIWNYLNGQPVTTRVMHICETCGCSYSSPTRKPSRFCTKECRNTHWHRMSVKRRQRKNNPLW